MKILVKYIFVFIAIGAITSCKKFLDVNENPNAPTTAPINGLLARITQNAALNVFRVSYNITSNYVQYTASPNAAAASDIYEPIDASSTWTFLYDNMTDAYDLEKMAKERGATQYQGVAKIVMAMDLHLVHNVWGSAPFTQAFTSETLTPAYDNAEVIFAKCISLLDEGIALLGEANSTITIPVAATGNPDLIHKGITAAWIRTAHALKARLLNQLSKKAQYNPTAILQNWHKHILLLQMMHI
ncbi:MAG: SusD/RagB family nutrient-binding outer membrane lipoprotein [Chitinophagaceae bacterium]|nr:SusD/RagB family nutrient-binding outer membrane lipoprotein [Chitinophagaceae bacterium]